MYITNCQPLMTFIFAAQFENYVIIYDLNLQLENIG